MQISYINEKGLKELDYEIKNFKIKNLNKEIEIFNKILNQEIDPKQLKVNSNFKNSSLIHSNKKISREEYLDKFKKSNFSKFLNKNKKYLIPCLMVGIIGMITVTGLDASAATKDFVDCFARNNSQNVLMSLAKYDFSKSFSSFEGILSGCLTMAKRILVYSVIINTIKSAILTLWSDSGNLNWSQIFGTVFKNLAFLSVGLAIDVIAWDVYRETLANTPQMVHFLTNHIMG